MVISKDIVLNELDSIISMDRHGRNKEEQIAIIKSTIYRFSETGSVYRNRCDEIIKAHMQVQFVKTYDVVGNLLGVLKALRYAYEQDHLKSMEELIHADLFSDFLEMADYLLDEGGFKDAAAVMAGSVLEEHLRKLCDKNGIKRTDAKGKAIKAELMNEELKKSDAYSKGDQKNVTAWLDLRNKAAHATIMNIPKTKSHY